jgi:hypothetical protein
MYNKLWEREYLLWYALAGSLLGLLFVPEDGGNTLLRNVKCYQTTRLHISEDSTLHCHRRENLNLTCILLLAMYFHRYNSGFKNAA